MTSSLRIRLILAFMAMVSLMLVVGITSFQMHRSIRADVAVLRPYLGVDLSRVALFRVGLEIEGYWDPAGSFVATDIEVLPRIRRPRLRGAIQEVNPQERTMTLYGVPIQVPASIELTDANQRAFTFESLRPGDRVEVTCEVGDRGWVARKLKIHDVKSSNKIKGTVTSADPDAKAPVSLEIHGLIVSVPFEAEHAPESALRHVSVATELMLALQECRTAAYELIEQSRPVQTSDQGGDRGERIPSPTGDRLERAMRDFVDYLTPSGSSQTETEGSPPLPPNRWVHRLLLHVPDLGKHIATLVELARSQPEAARDYLAETLTPFLEQQLQPSIHAYLSQSEEELGDQLRGIEARTATTTQVALATSAVAVLVALALGLLVWRSIHNPIVALHAAAIRLGHGHLETRVSVRFDDELGDLAEAFNRMAEELSSTTVSMSNLENIFNSMAGALILLDPDRRITSVNRSALILLGYEKDELLGQPLELVCPSEDLDLSLLSAGDEATQDVSERNFLRRDGSAVPVSFSAAELRHAEGSMQGYVCVAQDLTEHKRIAEQVRKSLAEKELLLREVHHRVKSNMQVICSMLAMQSSDSDDPRVVESLEECQARIRSMALIHEHLYQSSDLGHIDLRVYLDILMRHLEQSHGMAGKVSLQLNLENLDLDLDRSLSCGLIVSELVANAYRHAFEQNRSGVITVGLSAIPGDLVELEVSDDGRGLSGTDQSARQETLGMNLVKALTMQLGGDLHVRGSTGTVVRIVFPRIPRKRAMS